jgi:hypothetical protein
MKKVTFLAAAAAVTALVATPVLAQDTAQPRSAAHAKGDKTMTHRMNHHAQSAKHMRHHARMDRRDEMTSRDDWNRGGGFWPANVAGGIVGGAIGTAGAIATAPIGGQYRGSYAYHDDYGYGPRGYDVGYAYDGVAIPQSSSYAARNGFVCQPGTVTRPKNGSGVPMICQ